MKFWALALAVALVTIVCAAAWTLGRRPGPWQTLARTR